MSRTDDIINVAGHRLSTGAIEEVLSEHNSVAECAVVGIADKLKGQLPIGLLTLKAGVDQNNDRGYMTLPFTDILSPEFWNLN